MMEAEPEMSRPDLARRLGVSRTWVTRVLGPRSEVRDVTAEAV
jgi:DNA-binding LacI/PurR family transcriptional regulator